MNCVCNYISICITICYVYTSASAWAALPEAYQVIAQRNLFSPSRVGTPPRSEAAALETPTPTETITLTGVAVLDGEATALFSGSTPSLSGARRVGEAMDNARITTISTAGVSFDTGGQGGDLRLAVGQSLRRLPGQAWQWSADAVSAPAAAPATEAAPAAQAAPPTAAPAGDAGDILKRLLERRQKEMKP
jgi:hypothetical protein